MKYLIPLCATMLFSLGCSRGHSGTAGLPVSQEQPRLAQRPDVILPRPASDTHQAANHSKPFKLDPIVIPDLPPTPPHSTQAPFVLPPIVIPNLPATAKQGGLAPAGPAGQPFATPVPHAGKAKAPLQSYSLSEIDIITGPNGQIITRPKKKDPDSMKIGIADPNESSVAPFQSGAFAGPGSGFQFPTHEQLEQQVLQSPLYQAQMKAIDQAQKDLRMQQLEDAKNFTYKNPYQP